MRYIFLIIIIFLLTGCSNIYTNNDKNSQEFVDESNSYVKWKGCNKLKANVKTFQVLNSNYAKDKNYIYYYEYSYGPQQCLKIDKIKKNNNFTVINEKYAKDNKTIYRYGKDLGLNPNSFEFVNDFTLKDKNNVVIYGIKTNINPKTLNIINPRFVKDNQNVYFICKSSYKGKTYSVSKLKDISPKNFKIENDFIRGNSSIYLLKYKNIPGSCEPYGIYKLENVSVKSFEKINSNLYSDKNSLFFFDEYSITRINNVDSKNLKIIEENFLTDRKRVYYIHYSKDKVVNEIESYNSASIQILNGINGKSFELVEKKFSSNVTHYFLKDNESVYFFYDKNLTKIQNSKPKSFNWNSPLLAEDSNNIYRVEGKSERKTNYMLRKNVLNKKIVILNKSQTNK